MNAAKLANATAKIPASQSSSRRSAQARTVQPVHEIPNVRATIFPTIVRTLLAFLLVWAGLSKLGDPINAYTSLLDYQLPAPKVFLKLVAMVLPWLELLCGLMLLANFHRRLATLTASLLFGVFLIMVGQAAARGLDISCGCFNLAVFGINPASASARFLESVGFALLRDAILLAGAVYLVRIGQPSRPTTAAAGHIG